MFTIRRRYEESDNPIINTTRFFADRIRDMFGPIVEETEHGQTIAEIRAVDPTFELDTFLKESREFLIPEVVEAVVEWRPDILRQWCSEAVVTVLEAAHADITQDGHTAKGQVLDLRNVELVMAKMMDNVPLLVLTFKTQQTETVYDKHGAIVSGSPVRINHNNDGISLFYTGRGQGRVLCARTDQGRREAESADQGLEGG